MILGFFLGVVTTLAVVFVLCLLKASSRATAATEATDAPRESSIVREAEDVAKGAWR